MASASEKAMAAHPKLFVPMAPADLEKFPATGTCQKCRKLVNLGGAAHAC